MRYAIIDNKTNKVINVVEINDNDGSKVESGFTSIQSDIANIGWDYDAINNLIIIPPPPEKEIRK